ncbi:Phosphoserine phosphatase RsbP [Nonomuraea coxensis DSM 45129]|uniref:Phosphoserine phosphatase RsbP n=1 Tax=Nonomuraea coxensis DSM 45129 TaxID=1122611 RepID=A0ABX8U0A4_9ACTN|nr:SpoIIE family protein phosphatase [Nonomuraea coxensis]QYC40973.1 Phosphoserine phosphatase RsbP [Nonomuraea coxensis DSM 45129]
MGADDGRDDSGLALDMLDPAPVGVVVTRGPEHRLVYTNALFQSLFRDPGGKVPVEESFARFVQRYYRPRFDHVHATGEPIMIMAEPELPSSERPVPERFFTASLSRISFGPGDHGVLAMVIDVTDQVGAARRIAAIAEERRRLLHRLASLMEISAPIIWVTSRDGHVREPSPNWERVTGQTWEEYRGQGWLRMVHPDDRRDTIKSWARAVDDVSGTWEHVYRLRTRYGGYRHFRLRAVPICEDDRVVEWVGSSTDIEDQWREQRAQRLLDRAAGATARLRSLEEMLDALAGVIVPEIADGCSVYLVTDLADGRQGDAPLIVRRVATTARPGLRTPASYVEERLPGRHAFVKAVRRRRPLRRTFPAGSPPPGVVPDVTRPWLRDSGGNGALILPVVVDGTVPAVVVAVTCGDRPPIGEDDAKLLDLMFDHTHDALSRAIRFQRTQQVALALQYSLLAEPPRLPGLRIVARYRASPSAAEVGGDWYDSFVLPDGVPMLVIGDVAGHDLNAAVAMSQLRNMLRALAMDRREPPGDILSRLDTAMESLAGEVTATCVVARVEPAGRGHRLDYAVAGHPPPLLVEPGGRGRFLEEGVSPLLGALPGERRASREEPLPPGGTLLLYTDGLVERAGEHLDRGLERLRLAAERFADRPVDSFCDALLSELPTTGLDDIAVMALRLPRRR